MQASTAFFVPGAHWRERASGLCVVLLIAAIAALLASWSVIASWGLSTLTLAIVLGMLVGNTALGRLPSGTAVGIDFARSRLLRLGIVLFGFRISIADIASVGMPGVVLAFLIVGCTFGLALWVGKRLSMDLPTVILIGVGSAICGAAAVMGAQTVVRGSERSTSVAVATVVIFGTLSMFIYPLIFPLLNLTPQEFGLYAGATIHEVAQVVAVGATLGMNEAANAAVIEKMLRVVLLAPFLLLLAVSFRQPLEGGAPTAGTRWWHRIQVPWFAVAFLAAAVIHSSGWLPTNLVALMVQAANLLLAMGMVAIGLRTSASSLRTAGLQPLKLAAVLFLFLTLGGYLLTKVLTTWL